MAKDWVVVGSGPSASEFLPRLRGLSTATANRGFRLLLERPDLYGCFEKLAADDHHGDFGPMAEAGTRIVLTPGIRNYMRERYPAFLPEDVYVDDFNKATHKLARKHVNSRVWITSGVFLIWIVGVLYKPRAIHVVGVDGLVPTGGNYSGAAVRRQAGDPGLPERHCRKWNACAGRGVASITSHPNFRNIEVVWYGKPVHENAGKWNVTWGSA